MRIGYACEGTVDEGLIWGLCERWCPGAGLRKAPYRGSTHQSLRREYHKVFRQLLSEGVDLVVILTDANARSWRQVRADEMAKLPEKYGFLTTLGVPDRNIECWICANAGWIAERVGRATSNFQVDDPSGTLKNALGPAPAAKVRDIVKDAPLKSWLANNSFEAFYEDLRVHAKRLGCEIENLRDAN